MADRKLLAQIYQLLESHRPYEEKTETAEVVKPKPRKASLSERRGTPPPCYDDDGYDQSSPPCERRCQTPALHPQPTQSTQSTLPPKPKRVMSEKQLAALAAGRERAAQVRALKKTQMAQM